MSKAQDRTILVSAAAALISVNLVAMSLLGDDFEEDDATTPLTADAPAVSVARQAPAYEAAEDLLRAALPKGWKRKGKVQPGVVDVLELACGVDSQSTAILGYNRSVRIGGKNMVAAVEVWPTGQGAAVIAEYANRARACARSASIWVKEERVAGFPAVVVGIQSESAGSRTLRWSIGDVTLSLTGDAAIDNLAVAKRWTRIARKALAPVCADLKPKPADARRSPWVNPDDYQGLLKRVKVAVNKPLILVPDPPNRPRLQNLPDVERPDQPQGVPIWPAKLPAAMQKPTAPKQPTSPKFGKRVPYQIPDPVGPGCGWKFTISPVPDFTEEESQQQREEVVARATRKLQASADQWAIEETAWRQKQARYLGRAADYREYAATVKSVAKKWDKIREDWAAYNKALNDHYASIAARDDWNLRWPLARKEWLANKCPPGTPRPPAPSPVPSGSPTPAPAPTPDCLFDIPKILTQTEPGVLPKPTKPADPRPKSAR